MALIFSLVFFPVFSKVNDFHFQANFPRLQAINHAIVHLDCGPFDISKSSSNSLLKAFGFDGLLRSGRKTEGCTGYSSSTYRKLSIDCLVRCGSL